MKINLNEINKVKEFIKITQTKPYDVCISSSDNKYRVDGKSIMGIFSLDLSKNLNLIIPKGEEKEFIKFSA